MKKILHEIILWIWCFPQMLAGLILKMVTGAVKNCDHYEYVLPFGSISLGTYIFLSQAHISNPSTLLHEKGHTKQSYILGWLYIPVILIPSMIWAGCFQKYREKHKISYYSFYTERWADKLSGVKRLL